MNEAEQFFFEHAGFSVRKGETDRQGHERCARECALAEQWAKQNGYTFAWIDYGIYVDGNYQLPEGTIGPYVCVMHNSQEQVVQSLDDITLQGNTDPYRRIVQAELATDQMVHMAVLAPELQALVDYAS